MNDGIGSSASASVPHVVVLGGGYVSITLARAIAKAIRRGQARVTVVSRENFQVFHGFVGEMVTGRVSPSHILSPVRRLFPPANVHIAEIERIDLDARKVVTSRHLDGARIELDYDHLVLALGSADRTDVYPGLAEHAFRLKRYEDCFRLRNHVLGMFEAADIERDPEERRRLLTFFVAGGGYAGTELAGELADLATLLTRREFRGIDRSECRFVLVEPGKSIVPELYGATGSGEGAHPRLVRKAVGRMHKLGVEILTETAVAAVTPNEVLLTNGDRIPTRTVISAVGTRMPAVLDGLDLPRDPRGRIKTDDHLRVEGRQDIWAGGDTASVPKPGGGICPPVGIYALKHGATIGRNLALALEGRAPRPFRFRGLGQGASVGRRYAVAELKGLELWGLPAWVAWRLLLLYYFPSWDRRLRLIADWLIWPIVGRDVVQMQVGQTGDYEVRHNIFQPGEIITTELRQGRYIHIIVEGQVEMVEHHGDDKQVLATLGPGENFGIRWTESFEPEAARAKTVVKTVALRRDQAPRLQEVLGLAGRLSAQSGHFPIIPEGTLRAGAQAPPAQDATQA